MDSQSANNRSGIAGSLLSEMQAMNVPCPRRASAVGGARTSTEPCEDWERFDPELGRKQSFATSFESQARILQDRGELDAAMESYEEAARLWRALDELDRLWRNLFAKALILREQGKLHEAQKLLEETEATCHELGDQEGLVASLNTQGLILMSLGEVDAAVKCHEEVEWRCREAGEEHQLAANLVNHAIILRGQGEAAVAIELLREAGEICRNLGDMDGLRAVLSNQAIILAEQGQAAVAIELLQEAEEICRESGHTENLARVLANQASLLGCSMRETDRALSLAEESHQLATSHGLTDIAGLAERILSKVRSLADPRHQELTERDASCRFRETAELRIAAMRRRQARLRFLKWAGAIVCALLLVAWCGGLLGAVGYPFRLGLAGLIVLTALLWWRTQRLSPGRCQECGHDLAGKSSGLCPQCGTRILRKLCQVCKGEAARRAPVFVVLGSSLVVMGLVGIAAGVRAWLLSDEPIASFASGAAPDALLILALLGSGLKIACHRALCDACGGTGVQVMTEDPGDAR